MKDFAYSVGLEVPVFLAVQMDKARQLVVLHAYEVARDGDFPERFTIGADYTPSPFNPEIKLHRTSSLTIDFRNLRELVGEKELTPFSNIYFPVSDRGELRAPFNKMAASYALKEPGGRYLQRTSTGVVGQLCVPFPDARFEDCGLRLTAYPELGLFVEGATPREMTNTHEAFQAFVQNLMPQLVAATPEIDVTPLAPVTVQFQLTPPRAGVKVHLKSDMGYLPKRELVTDAAGRITAKIWALSLDAGDEFDVEAGFKWYSNIARTRVKVVAP
ncbi:hypothetical protein [Cupriavidus sp. DL-D2]|uniref:hypothetical protein n=1 Tax=Cupriavidus sp. DL-D2 TaxID=3144974 RepID=UPI00321264CA